MRTIGAAILASSLIVSSAFAATDGAAPLAPGKPAGVKQAQEMDNHTLLIVLGLGVVAGGIALVASGGGGHAAAAGSTSTSTSSSTSTSATGTNP